MLLGAPGLGIDVARAAESLAFPEKFEIRLASYAVQNAETDLAVFSSQGLGTGFSFVDDLGGEDSATIPRLDAFYRFDSKHRIEFAYFRIERDGINVLQIELDIGDQTFSTGDTVLSNIDYELLKAGYAYSFYRSPEVELSVTAGLNFTTYEFDYERADGSARSSADASGPLPMFGLRLSYAINERWSLHYLSEAFYIRLGDEYAGSFQNNEINVQYRIGRQFKLGAGISRFSTDLEAKDSDWKGRIADTHRGLLVFASYYL